MTADGRWVLDPQGLRYRDGQRVAWPVWAIQVQATHLETADPFVRVVLRLLRSGLSHVDEVAAACDFPDELVRTILRAAEHKGWVHRTRDAWSLEEEGEVLLHEGAAPGSEVLEWMFVCGRSGAVLPGRLPSPLPRDKELDELPPAPPHRDGRRPDPDDLGLRVRLNRMASRVDRLEVAPDEDPVDLGDDLFFASMGTLGSWTEDESDEDEEGPAPAQDTGGDAPLNVVPTGQLEPRWLLLLATPGARVGELDVPDPLRPGASGRFYATRLLNDRPARGEDDSLATVREELQQEAARRALEAGGLQAVVDVEAAVVAVRHEFGPVSALPEPLRAPFVGAEVARRIARETGSYAQAARSLRVLIEATMDALARQLPVGLPDSVRDAPGKKARWRLARRAVEQAGLLSGRELDNVSRAVSDSHYRPLRVRIARSALWAALPPSGGLAVAGLLAVEPGLFKEASQLVKRLNPHSHGERRGRDVAELTERAHETCLRWLTAWVKHLGEADGQDEAEEG